MKIIFSEFELVIIVAYLFQPHSIPLFLYVLQKLISIAALSSNFLSVKRKHMLSEISYAFFTAKELGFPQSQDNPFCVFLFFLKEKVGFSCAFFHLFTVGIEVGVSEGNKEGNMSTTTINLIGAVSQENVIGVSGKIPWRYPADMAFFKEKTMGYPIVMGRITYETLTTALPGRTNLVLSKELTSVRDGYTLFRHPEAVLQSYFGEELFIIGGAQIYREFLPYATAIYLTRLPLSVKNKQNLVYFPEIDPLIWQIREENIVSGLIFQTYTRKNYA